MHTSLLQKSAKADSLVLVDRVEGSNAEGDGTGAIWPKLTHYQSVTANMVRDVSSNPTNWICRYCWTFISRIETAAGRCMFMCTAVEAALLAAIFRMARIRFPSAWKAPSFILASTKDGHDDATSSSATSR